MKSKSGTDLADANADPAMERVITLDPPPPPQVENREPEPPLLLNEGLAAVANAAPPAAAVAAIAAVAAAAAAPGNPNLPEEGAVGGVPPAAILPIVQNPPQPERYPTSNEVRSIVFSRTIL